MADSLDALVRTVLTSGGAEVRPVARLMTLIENAPHRLPELFRAVRAVAGGDAEAGLTSALARLQPRLLVGITGAPGSGKSTLTDALVRDYRHREPARRIGVVAVDPSSPFTGGAVLGDRVRMMRHATDPMVFVRSVASRGHLGGLSLGVKGIIHVLGLAGADVVFVETVGVGQSEIEVARVADLVVIVLAPGQGDSVQLLKAGLMEIGDLFVVNKADRPDAERLHSQLLATLRLQYPYEAEGHDEAGAAEPILHVTEAARHADGSQQVLLASATDGRGIVEIADWIETAALRERDRLLARREAALTSDFREAVLEAARRRLGVLLEKDDLAREAVERLVRGEATVEGLAHELVVRASEDRGPVTVRVKP